MTIALTIFYCGLAIAGSVGAIGVVVVGLLWLTGFLGRKGNA